MKGGSPIAPRSFQSVRGKEDGYSGVGKDFGRSVGNRCEGLAAAFGVGEPCSARATAFGVGVGVGVGVGDESRVRADLGVNDACGADVAGSQIITSASSGFGGRGKGPMGGWPG